MRKENRIFAREMSKTDLSAINDTMPIGLYRNGMWTLRPLALITLAACTMPQPVELGNGAFVRFITEDLCMITMPEQTGRPEEMKFENLYYLLEGRWAPSIGLYSYSHELPKHFAFSSGGVPLFDHTVGFEGEFSLSICYETNLKTGETFRVECELEGSVTTPDMQRFPLTDEARKSLITAFAPDRPERSLEVRSLRTVRHFSVPPEAHAYLLDPEAACLSFAARSVPE